MLKRDVRIGAVYAAKVSGKLSPVRIDLVCSYGGWYGFNEQTGRKVRIKSARKLRYEVGKEGERWVRSTLLAAVA